MNTLLNCLALFVLTISISTVGYGQQQKASELAFQTWIENRTSVDGNGLSSGQIAIAFAAERYQEIGVNVDVSVFAGEGTDKLPAMEFIVQPMQSEKQVDGSVKMIDVGHAASLKSTAAVRTTNSSRPILQPGIIARVPAHANAVRIVVKGLGDSGQEYSVTLPLKKEPTTAVIANR